MLAKRWRQERAEYGPSSSTRLHGQPYSCGWTVCLGQRSNPQVIWFDTSMDSLGTAGVRVTRQCTQVPVKTSELKGRNTNNCLHDFKTKSIETRPSTEIELGTRQQKGRLV